jgi:DNA mismatch repair protein MutL
MSRIRILPTVLRNKIAAGEVIERPASVVKELVENSIDAGSTRIEITVSGAGKKLIRISDNGCGMDRGDALPAFERYATSKITEEADLYRIRTMGFRGEALSSIASVSRVRLVTAPKDSQDQTGVAVEIAGGEVRDERDCPASGTVIEVKDLFFNTPARRKFLKADSTENYHIIDAVTREALVHYDTGFTLRVEDDDLLSLVPASSLRERLAQVYGKRFCDAMMEAEAGDEALSIKAFFCRPSDVRSNRNGQFVFINRRPVRDQAINHAVCRAYEDIMPRGKHPVFFIFIGMDPEKIDVNVHPAKREVRFEDKTGVYDLIFRTAREAIRGSAEAFNAVSSGDVVSGSYTAGVDRSEVPSGNTGFQPMPAALAETQAMPYEVGARCLYICETFMVVADGQGLSIVDYHAAHERINYERLLKRHGGDTQRLLFPRRIKLDAGAYRAALQHAALFRDFGIEIEDFGHGTVLVRSLPVILMDADMQSLLCDAAECLIEKASAGGTADDPLAALRRSVAARIACHSSVRGRETPDGVKLAAILKDLEACEEPDRCPHGRPARIRITAAELRKMFRK